MIRYLVSRIAQAAVVLFCTSLATFVIFSLLPSGDPAIVRAGRRASPEILAHVRVELGLNRSLPMQYWIFLRNLVGHLNLGYSYQDDEAVRSLIASHLIPTMSVAVGAAIVWMLMAIPTGVLAGLRPDGLFDRFLAAISLITYSLPTYAVAFLGLLLVGDGIGRFHLLPGINAYVSPTQSPGHWFTSLLLPWITLGITFFGYYARLMRSSLLETMPEDFVRTARAKGLSERKVVFEHALRVAIGPIITSFGLDLGLLLGGAIITEIVFGIPGIGTLSLQAVQQSDLPLIEGTVLMAAVFVVTAILAIDLIHAGLDPRLRLVGRPV